MVRIKGEMRLGIVAFIQVGVFFFFFLTFKIEMPYRQAALFLQFVVTF